MNEGKIPHDLIRLAKGMHQIERKIRYNSTTTKSNSVPVYINFENSCLYMIHYYTLLFDFLHEINKISAQN